MYTENNYLMWLSYLFEIGISKLNTLMDYFGSAREIWSASIKEIIEVIKINEKNLHKFSDSRTNEFMEKNILNMQKLDINFIGISEKEYPRLLREIDNPPLGLYVKGKLPDEGFNKVSIIGSRKCSEYGQDVAYKFSRELAENNIVIVSGMADGIDSVAHKAAVDSGGKTIAVLGNGVDICYPSFNRPLRDKIVENGCVISEYPPGISPKAYYFPVRNRIISGLSSVTAVIEAEEKSGTLITVNQAIEQGRTVFAVPGSVMSKKSKGTNNLLKTGVNVLTSPKDILTLLGIEINNDNKINSELKYQENNKNIENYKSNEINNSNQNNKNNKKIVNTLENDEKLVYDCISLNPISVDELFIKTKKEMGILQYLLTMLEIKGVIKKLSGQKYVRS